MPFVCYPRSPFFARTFYMHAAAIFTDGYGPVSRPRRRHRTLPQKPGYSHENMAVSPFHQKSYAANSASVPVAVL